VGFSSPNSTSKTANSIVFLLALYFLGTGAYYLYDALKKNTRIKEVNIDRNDLQGIAIKELTHLLWANQTMEVLSMNDCKLRDIGMIYVIDGLEKNAGLVTVSLKRNGMTAQSAKNLNKLGRSKHSRLEKLVLSHNPIGVRGLG